jgi:putative transposase
MARLARVVAEGIPHHVTQRGNAGQFLLNTDADRMVYLDLLRQAVQLFPISIIGYCFMSNHVHLVIVPHKAEALAAAMKQTHGRYATYWNASHTSSGHAWQGRFYSCPLDDTHLWATLRYTERNPVRAGLVASPELWPWSSAAAHCGKAEPDICLEMETWRKHWTVSRWQMFLDVQETEAELAAIRQCTHTGRPLGSPEFIKSLEESTQRKLEPRKGGRRSKPTLDLRQEALEFE